MHALIDQVTKADMAKLRNIMAAAIMYAKSGQRGGVLHGRYHHTLKPDGSPVTTLDTEVEALVIERARKTFPRWRIFGEEGVAYKDVPGDALMLIVDPCDGTRSLIMGSPTSTIIMGVVHPTRGLVASLIGVISTGAVYFAFENEPTRFNYIGSYGRYETSRKCTVSDSLLGGDNKRSQVWIDKSSGYKATAPDGTKYDVVTREQNCALLCTIAQNARLGLLGSNGLHHALIAGGEPYCCGAYSVGVNSWDLVGLLTVVNAGGCVQGYTVNRDTGMLELQLGKPHGFDPMTADAVLVANNLHNMTLMQRWLDEATGFPHPD